MPANDYHAVPACVSSGVKAIARKEKLLFHAHIWYKVSALSGCRIMALLQLPKLITRVRFPSPAPLLF
ncbi:hypothetical protein EMIT0P253_250076 [Pseudomonas sp. IT-P253]